MKRFLFFTFVMSLFFSKSISQEKILLYPQGATESNELKTEEKWRDKDFLLDISEPRMYAYLASKENNCGTAVLICPGGGYAGVSAVKEGEEFARWFNKLGVSAFVLYYRMPNRHHEIPLKDAQTALSIIQKRAREWKINKNKIGIMGFSAGGHLASTVGTHFRIKAERPAFMLLAYPVVTMNKDLTHNGSRDNLLGKNPSDELVKLYSNELQVKKQTPPTFIIHARDDGAVPIANSENLLEALQKNKVPAKLVTYDEGGHGFGMRKKGIPVENWPQEMKAWLTERKLISK